MSVVVSRSATFSPGIVKADSQVFARPEAMGDTLPGTGLHVTSDEQEMLGDLPVHQNLAKNAATFLHRLTSHDQLCIP
ncbi:hypothetical protein [Streptomyces labedae]|uniref:Uncharacterized protein n=1 Tax=Streptomyces labedae TaxID=285569 RepID=A0ABP6QXR4_9ACTN